MKHLFTSLCISFILFFFSCGPSVETLQMSFKKTDKHEHLIDKLWMIKPLEFKSARTFNGFQGPNYEASISVKQVYDSYKNLHSTYFKDVSQPGLDLLDAIYLVNDNDTIGFLIKADFTKSKIINYDMIIASDSKLYKLNAFYPNFKKSEYEKIITSSLLNIAQGEQQVRKEFFNLASISDKRELIYTKDGLYPTKSPDSLTVYLSQFDFNGQYRNDMYDLSTKAVNEWKDENQPEEFSKWPERRIMGSANYVSTKFSTDIQRGFIRIFCSYSDNSCVKVLVLGSLDVHLDTLDKHVKDLIYGVDIYKTLHKN